jgi:hypothetical protein
VNPAVLHRPPLSGESREPRSRRFVSHAQLEPFAIHLDPLAARLVAQCVTQMRVMRADPSPKFGVGSSILHLKQQICELDHIKEPIPSIRLHRGSRLIADRREETLMRQRSHPTLECCFEKALPALMLFRAYRNDTPVVFDPHQEWQITGGAIGVDMGYGNVVKVGVNGTLNHSSTEIGRWDGGQ